MKHWLFPAIPSERDKHVQEEAVRSLENAAVARAQRACETAEQTLTSWERRDSALRDLTR